VLELVQQASANRILEIGTFEGGTLALLAQAAPPDASLLSLDINYCDHRLYSYPKLARSGQTITCYNADTHSSATQEFVRAWLAGDKFDVIFIDGDHSYPGVKADYEMYSLFIRPGGFIAFHDIHPDYKTRFGRQTENDVGEVPAFWKELKQSQLRTNELIEDPDQDGYGIGIIQM
jgi:predicted O-methyltransferase YrrM